MGPSSIAANHGEGMFVVIEGIDGAGTTTLTDSLAKHFRAERRAVHRTCEPSNGPIGALIRQVLTRRLVIQTAFGASSPGWATMALLFAADRQDHLEAEIVPLLRDGVMVFCDRYDLSSLTYQTATSGTDEGAADSEAPKWIRQLNVHARRPDLTIVLDVPAEVAAQRRRHRGGGQELYEDRELQNKLAELYLRAEKLLPTDRIVHVHGDRPADQVLQDAVAAVASVWAGVRR